MTEPRAGAVAVVGATIALAFKGIIARVLFADGFDVVSVMILRAVFALPFFVLGAFVSARRSSTTTSNTVVQKPFILLAVLFVVSTGTDFVAVDRLGAGVARLILFTFPFFVLGLESYATRTRPPTRQMLGAAVGFVGVALVIDPRSGALDVVGVVAALTSSVVYAGYLFLLTPVLRTYGAMRVTIHVQSWALLFMIPLGFIDVEKSQRSISLLSSHAPLFSILIVLVTVLPFWLLFYGMKRTGSSMASLLMMLGPIVTVVAAAFVLNEQFAFIQGAGCFFVLVGVALAQSSRSVLISNAGMVSQR